jgi:hypothetical protein
MASPPLIVVPTTTTVLGAVKARPGNDGACGQARATADLDSPCARRPQQVWVGAKKEQGVERLLGLDGIWIPPEKILDRAIEFQHQDLTKGVHLGESFDLALSLEVAEHLPPDAADGFVKLIASSADAVVFSAAFVGQPGAGHVNTRPHSYWAARFLAEGYQLFDILRPEFWSDNRVEPWYRQNTFLYVRAKHLSSKR